MFRFFSKGPKILNSGVRYNSEKKEIGYEGVDKKPSWISSIFRSRTKKAAKNIKSLANKMKLQKKEQNELEASNIAYPKNPNIYANSSQNLREAALDKAAANAKAQANADKLFTNIYGNSSETAEINPDNIFRNLYGNNNDETINDPEPLHFNDPEPLAKYGGTRRRKYGPKRKNKKTKVHRKTRHRALRS